MFLPNHRLLFTALALLVFLEACSPHHAGESSCKPGSMVAIPAGWFLMGENEGRESNQPQRLSGCF
jgi:hypothetical protein